MKKIFLICNYFLFFIYSKGQINNVETKNTKLEYDMFMHHYNKLDSLHKNKQPDTTGVTKISVNYMQLVTGLKAHWRGHHGGIWSFSSHDLTLWKLWYIKNKAKRSKLFPVATPPKKESI